MKILVTEKNRDRIAAAVAEGNGRSRERVITVDDVFSVVADLDKALAIPRKAMVGTTAHVDLHTCVLPRSYKYSAKSTHFMLEHTAGGWALTRVFRHWLTQRDSYNTALSLSDSAKDALIKRFSTIDL